MNRSTFFGGILLLVATGSAWAETAATAEQQWQQHMTEMRQLHQNWMAGKTPEERQRLMQEHQKAMGRGMQSIGGCMMADGKGMGMGGGMGQGMMRMDTVEQVDQRIQHMEQMVEQLRAHREMLAKPKP